MHKVKQKPGGCVAACLASILECGLESVPAMELANPGQGDWDCYWIDRVAPWLAERGLCLQASAGSDAPCGYVIGIIESDVDGAPGHAVVLLDSRLEWDPSELMIGQIELSGTLAFHQTAGQEHVPNPAGFHSALFAPDNPDVESARMPKTSPDTVPE